MKILGKIAMLWWLFIGPLLPLSAGQQPNTPGSGSPQTQAATTPDQEHQSAPQAVPAQTQPSPQQVPEPGVTQSPSQSLPAQSPPRKPVVKRKKKKSARTHTDSGKVVVRNGGVSNDSVQLAPAMSKEQELRSRQGTEQLLASTDANLKSVAGRQLSPAQQSMLDEIHTYVRQSKGATDSGDLTRAHTLAYKALLLSGELAKK